MEDLSKLKEQLLNERPVPWDSLPDIDLYMDQLINYMSRQQLISSHDSMLTSAMVNNYIKANLLERANGKKYSRNHLAELSIICFLKQVISVKDAALVFNQFSKDEVQNLYSEYLKDLDKALNDVSEKLPDTIDDMALAEMVMHLSIVSYANKLTCLRLIDFLQEKDDSKKQIKKPKGDI